MTSVEAAAFYALSISLNLISALFLFKSTLM